MAEKEESGLYLTYMSVLEESFHLTIHVHNIPCCTKKVAWQNN